MRKAEAVRDRTMRGAGTGEPWVMEEMSREIGELAISVHWRKPLSLEEVARMAPTPEVKAREGRG
jgi:hypothetical protein